MNVTSSIRRSDQPLQIGSRHGYRIDGDLAHINAELSVPPYHPGGVCALELWACERAYQGGELSGVKVSEVQFELPTPIAPHTHRIEAQVPARLPLQGRAHRMLLALVEQSGDRRVLDVAQYPELETFPAPHFEGDVGYEIRGREVVLQAAAVVNPRPAGNSSGTLSLELWALPIDAEGVVGAVEAGGHCLAAAQVSSVAGGESAAELRCRAAFVEPPPGCFQLVLSLREWSSVGYLTRDRRAFALPYRMAAEPSAPLPAAVAPAAPLAEAPASEALEARAAEAPAAEAPAAEALAAEAPAAAAEAPAAEAPAAEAPAAEAPAAEAPAAEAPAAEAPAAEAPAAEAPAAEAPAAAAEARAAEAPAAEVARRASRAVSIQTASLDELARVKGLNTKIAREIIKARPFASLDELLKVHGIGRKTFDRLRSLVTL